MHLIYMRLTLVVCTSVSHRTDLSQTVDIIVKNSHCRPRVKLEACCTTIHSYLCWPIVLITADLMEEVYVFFVFLYCMYLSRIRFLAETDRLVMTLFVVVTTNSVFSRAILPVMVLASTSKTGMVILRGLFHESFVSVTHRLVCCQETLLLFILTIILLYDSSLTCKFTPTLQAHTRWFKWACSHDW